MNRESFLANYGKEGNSQNFSSADDSRYTVCDAFIAIAATPVGLIPQVIVTPVCEVASYKYKLLMHYSQGVVYLHSPAYVL